MIFTDKLTVRHYHSFMPLNDSGLRSGERLNGILIWEREAWPNKGYYVTSNTWRNRLRYKLYRLNEWLAWRECDLRDEISTRFKKGS